MVLLLWPAFFLFPAQVFCMGRMPLDGASWKVVNANQSIHVAARVPGSVYTDLMAAGVLGDPYYRFNDRLYRWVAYDNWTYSRTLEVNSSFLSAPEVLLVAEGLDTVAQLYVNGKSVGKADNMFRQWKWPIKGWLKEGTNTIQIAFESPVTYASSEANKSAYVVPPLDRPAENGEKHRNFIRKMQASFSWDWGPAFPTMGIWKSIYLQSFKSTPVSAVMPSTLNRLDPPRNDSWMLNQTTCFDVGHAAAVRGRLSIGLGGNILFSAEISLKPGQECHNNVMPIKQIIKAWWPNGMGAQTMYKLQTNFTDASSNEVFHDVRKIGFRTIELVQEPITGSPGLSFYFRVNGRPTFMKGSNWIPADVFQERLTRDYLHRLLTSAVEVNMNILRVWGGGVYESDTFYELADELGILIWQDCMFACAMYPATHAFLDNVRQEITYQVRRIMYHPSIALWSANNENEEALKANWYDTAHNYSLYLHDYLALYIGTVYDVIAHQDPARPFLPSSPTNGKQSQAEGWVAKDPKSQYYGDVHYYNYTANNWDWRIYKKPRFASEYGTQSWCSLEGLKNVSIPKDWDFDGEFAQSRQHHTKGNTQMKNLVAMNLKLPATNKTALYFEHMIYLTQINQAMSIKTETEHYRRLQGHLVGFMGHTMGALYWQINDIWQAPTWASIEYGGKWKMLHYYAKHFFSDLLISPYLNGSDLMVYVIQNPSAIRSGLWSHKDVQPNLVVQCQVWNNFMALNSLFIPLNHTTAASTLVFRHDLRDLLQSACLCSNMECFLTMYLDVAPDIQNVFFPDPPKDVKTMTKAVITVKSVTKVEEKIFQISLSTTQIAAFVWLEATGIHGRFSDNGFMLVKPEVTINFYAWSSRVTITNLMSTLKAKSLMDVYA